MDRTKIAWTESTWNPLRGCSPVSDGCRNCYAAAVAYRFKGPGQPYEGLAEWRGGETNGRAVFNGQIRFVESAIDQPLRWKRPRRIFVNSMSDLFHENVPDVFIARVFAVMIDAPRHTFQVLTKRPDRMAAVTTSPVFWYMVRAWLKTNHRECPGSLPLDVTPMVRPHIWLGTTVENQAAFDTRIEDLVRCEAAVKWLSMEPLLEGVDISAAVDPLDGGYVGRSFIHWVVAGGESGHGARPADPDWFRDIRDQCVDAGVPFFFKQHGTAWGGDTDLGRRQLDAGVDVHHFKGGDVLDGERWQQYPDPEKIFQKGC